MGNAASQEYRRQVYEQLAREQCGEYVAVRFLPHVIAFDGKQRAGLAQWSGYGYFEILIDANLPLATEAEVVAHEVAHVQCKHPAQIAPTYLKRAFANRTPDAPGDSSAPGRNDNEWWAERIGQVIVANWRLTKRIEW